MRSGMCLKGWQICSETSTKQTLKCGSCVFCQRMRIRVNWVNLCDFHETCVTNVTINLSIFMKPRYPVSVHSELVLTPDVLVWSSMWPYGFVWKCWVNIPNEIAIFHRDNDQQNHWVQWGLAYFQTHPYVTSMWFRFCHVERLSWCRTQSSKTDLTDVPWTFSDCSAGAHLS